MNDFKVPYIVYPIVLGVAAGWLISSIAGAAFITPKPLPVPKVKKAVKDSVSADDRMKSVTEANVFALALNPAGISGAASAEVSSSSDETIYDDGAAASPPPFKASLIGLIFDEADKRGIAVITLENATVSIALGKEKEGVKLAGLTHNSATIEKDGKKYSLIMESAALTQNSSKEQGGGSGVKVSDSGSNINITVPRAELQNELKDLNKILQSALISPFYKEGNFTGYRVAKMKSDSPLRKLGLSVGDVITRINGSEIKSPEILFGIFSQIDDISAINVDMLRNNEKKSVFVEIQ